MSQTEIPKDDRSTTKNNANKIKIGAYFSLIFAMIFFSGIMGGKEWLNQDWWGIFDFSTLNGKFGAVTGAVSNINGELVTQSTTLRGSGGYGAMDGFLFAFGLIPTVMFALGMISVFEHYGALDAARKLLTPVIRPLLGIPGHTGLALIGSLQSTDVGASLTRSLMDDKQLSVDQADTFAMFQFSAGAMLTNFFSSGAILFTLLDHTGNLAVPTTLGACFVVMFLMKIFGANLMRFYIKLTNKKHAASA